MRTDPRAAEVRSIVTQAFAGFLRASKVDGPRESAASPQPARRSAKCGASGAIAGQDRGRRSTYPRLYDPAGDTGPVAAAAESLVAAPALEIDETILIDQGRYVARSYRAAGYLAMWLVAVGILQFYDSRGRMLATINLFESLRPKRLAA